MVDAIQRLASALGLKTIAEFVESKATLQRLCDIGVDFAQGYAIHRPEPLFAAYSGMLFYGGGLPDSGFSIENISSHKARTATGCLPRLSGGTRANSAPASLMPCCWRRSSR